MTDKCFYKQQKNNFILVLIIFLQLAIITCIASHKYAFFIDELWSFNLANSNNVLCLGEASSVFNKWHSRDFWQSLLTVSSDNRFNYLGVYLNQAADVHPPLYYAVLHTVCSLFPEQFSKWYAIVPNMVAFALTQMLLYRVSCHFIKDTWIKFLPVIWYGFSAAAVNIVIFMRMYSLFTLWCVLFVYLSANIPEAEEKRRKHFVYLGLNVICGLLTHYYFLIFLFFMLLWYGGYLWFANQKLLAKQYVGTSCYAGILAVLLYPYMIKHILGIGATGYRGAQSFYMLWNASFWDKAKLLLQSVDGLLLFSCLDFLTGVLICSVILGLYLREKGNNNYFKLLALLIVNLSYFTVLAQICVYTNSKYISNIFPLIVLSIVGVLYNASKNWHRFITRALALVVLIMSCSSAYNMVQRNDIYNQKFKSTIELLQGEYRSVPVFSINKTATWDPFMNQVQLLVSAERSYVVKYSDIEKLDLDEERVVVSINSDCYYEISKIEDIFKKKGYRMEKQLIGASNLHELNVFIYVK